MTEQGEPPAQEMPNGFITNRAIALVLLVATALWALSVGAYFLGRVDWIAAHRGLVAAIVAPLIAPLVYVVILQFRRRRQGPATLLPSSIVGTLFAVPVLCLWSSTGADVVALNDFFTTSAQVIAGLLIALVIENRRLEVNQRNVETQLSALYFIVLGLGAAMLALLPWTGELAWAAAAMVPLLSGCLAAICVAVLSLASGLVRQ